jgi:hypothetical protein
VRPARLWAIARQDWALELGGRQGLLLPGLLFGLLAGPALAPEVKLTSRGWRAEGDVPASVAALPQDPDGAVLTFRSDAGRLHVDGDPPAGVRTALDGAAPLVRLEVFGLAPRLPGRTALFGLISASTLSGAVAASIGGERSRKTLGVLLSAAISTVEIVAGKALAWALFGLGSVVVASAVSMALGRVEAGWWLLPLLTMPLSTVALGFFLVRRATDVVAGTATSMRVLPAVVAGSGVFAFLVGVGHPLLAATIPVGGALVAAGDTWPGWAPPVIAAFSNLAFCAVMLGLTVRDLEETPSDDADGSVLRELAIVTALAASCWWIAVGTPVLYALAGNAAVMERLPVSRGVAAGAACLIAGTVLHLARRPGAAIPWAPPPVWSLAAALPVAAVSFLVHRAPVLVVGWPAVADRLHTAAAWSGPAGYFAVVADELLFRGWLPGRVGVLGAVVAAVVVKSPLDPLGGLLEAGVLGLLAWRSGTVWPGVLARCLALALQ